MVVSEFVYGVAGVEEFTDLSAKQIIYLFAFTTLLFFCIVIFIAVSVNVLFWKIMCCPCSSTKYIATSGYQNIKKYKNKNRVEV